LCASDLRLEVGQTTLNFDVQRFSSAFEEQIRRAPVAWSHGHFEFRMPARRGSSDDCLEKGSVVGVTNRHHLAWVEAQAQVVANRNCDSRRDEERRAP
jgi:hypothetical protein